MIVADRPARRTQLLGICMALDPGDEHETGSLAGRNPPLMPTKRADYGTNPLAPYVKKSAAYIEQHQALECSIR